MSCPVCRDRGYIQVAFGKSGEMQMTNRRCPECRTTEDELRMAKSEASRAPVSAHIPSELSKAYKPFDIGAEVKASGERLRKLTGAPPAPVAPEVSAARTQNRQAMEEMNERLRSQANEALRRRGLPPLDEPPKKFGKSQSEDGAPKVSKQGKLSEHTRARIGTVGSSKREEMPSHVFLLGKQRKYPVKLKSGGGWSYSPRLLLAAARRARMQGKPSLASRADAIRARLGKGFAPYVTGIEEHLLLKSQSPTLFKARLGSAWRWNCSCGHEGHGATEQEAIDQYIMHREQSGIPTGSWGPNSGSHALREVQDTRGSVEHAMPAMQGVPPAAAYMAPGGGIMGFLGHHG